MARSENRLVRDSPLPLSAQRLKTGDPAPNNQAERHAHSAYRKVRGSADLSTHSSDDRGLPVHSGKTPISRNPRPSLDAPPETNVQVCAQTDRNLRGSFVRGNCSNTSPSQPLEPSASNVSSENVVNSSPKNATMNRMHTMSVYRKTSRDHSFPALPAFPRTSFDSDGLAASSNNDRNESRTDQPVNGAMSQNCIHHRSASGTSELSTASCSSMCKPSPHYVHPMRQAPRTYTPPLNQSYQASIAESDNSADVEEEIVAPWGSDSWHQSMRGTPGQTPRLSLQTQEDPFTKPHGMSQTNLTGRPSFGYSRDAGGILDTASPISRSSLDFSFRSKTRTSMDPISRAATVQAARQAFEEKEAAKARKLEEQQLKAEARELRRKEKQPWRVSLKQDECREQAWSKEQSEGHAIPAPSRTASQPQPAPETWKSQPKNTWMHFLTWLRTRVFKIRRRINELG